MMTFYEKRPRFFAARFNGSTDDLIGFEAMTGELRTALILQESGKSTKLKILTRQGEEFVIPSGDWLVQLPPADGIGAWKFYVMGHSDFHRRFERAPES